jgi:hypothetical protein
MYVDVVYGLPPIGYSLSRGKSQLVLPTLRRPELRVASPGLPLLICTQAAGLSSPLAQRGFAAGKENQKAKISDPPLGPGWGGISTL